MSNILLRIILGGSFKSFSVLGPESTDSFMKEELGQMAATLQSLVLGASALTWTSLLVSQPVHN